MLTVDQYAASVVEKYQISPSVGSPSHHAADAVIPLLQRWGGQHLLGIALSGAYAKGTAITLSSSVDIVVSLHLSSEMEVRSEFWRLFEYLADQNLRPHTRTVSLQVESTGLRVDVLPTWPSGGSDQILYHKEPGSPFHTNLAQHVHLITKAGRSQEICALKIWRERHTLDFPSFYLELATLLALEGERVGQLAENVFTVLRNFAGRFEQAVIRDPANPDNVVSDDLTLVQKKTIAQGAARRWKTTTGKRLSGEKMFVRVPQCFVASSARPWRIRIEATPNRQYDFSHARTRKNAPLLTYQRAFGEDLHVMPLHEGWPRQTGFAGSDLDDGRALRPSAA